MRAVFVVAAVLLALLVLVVAAYVFGISPLPVGVILVAALGYFVFVSRRHGQSRGLRVLGIFAAIVAALLVFGMVYVVLMAQGMAY